MNEGSEWNEERTKAQRQKSIGMHTNGDLGNVERSGGNGVKRVAVDSSLVCKAHRAGGNGRIGCKKKMSEN